MSKGPVGELKKVVSLVDRTDFDEFVFPKDTRNTEFLPNFQSYHNFTQEATVWPFLGSPHWGQRITFSVPWPWQADFLNYLILRLKPNSWLTPLAQQHIGPEIADWVPAPNSNGFWVWANSLGTVAIERAEMEINGVIVEQFSGDWIDVWMKNFRDCSNGVPTDEMIGNYAHLTVNNFMPSEDGYIYCPLPFWFSKHVNTAFPLLSCSGPNTVRFHITLRPFSAVVRKLVDVMKCKETPCGQSFQIRNYYSAQYSNLRTIPIAPSIPFFETADFVCGLSHIDGELRKSYIETPHEILMSPVLETTFGEPLKYVVNTRQDNTIKIGLPILGNGPIQQLFFFLRRKAAVELFNDYTNYSALLTNEVDPVWNPIQPLLQHAQLVVGTAVWADEGEQWWRSNALRLPGGVRSYGNYIYGYNFAEFPERFSPSGSLNMSRVDIRLNLTILPPVSSYNTEWTVSVFLVGTNWMRFQNGIANQIFMD